MEQTMFTLHPPPLAENPIWLPRWLERAPSVKIFYSIASLVPENLYLDAKTIAIGQTVSEICLFFSSIGVWRPSWTPSWIFQNAQGW